MVGVFDKNVDTVASIRYGKLLNFVNKISSPNLQDLIIHIIFSHLISFEIVQMRLIMCFQTVYDPFFISAYNVFFTSMPIIVVGVFDKDVDTVASIRYGKLYSPGVSSQFFNRKLFAVDAMRGLFSSLVLAGFSAGTNSISLFRAVHV